MWRMLQAMRRRAPSRVSQLGSRLSLVVSLSLSSPSPPPSRPLGLSRLPGSLVNFSYRRFRRPRLVVRRLKAEWPRERFFAPDAITVSAFASARDIATLHVLHITTLWRVVACMIVSIVLISSSMFLYLRDHFERSVTSSNDIDFISSSLSR